MTKNWQDKAQLKRASVRDSIPAPWRQDTIKDEMEVAGYSNTREYLDSILPPEELAITNLTLVALQDKLATGKLTAAKVTEAYCHRAALAHQIVNCCSEIFFDRAMEAARHLDEYYSKHGKMVGKLHGIPISLKDQVDLPGFDSSIGYVCLLNQPKSKMSLLAEFLQLEGAVFYVKTTVPMAMLAPQTDSNIFGYTFNSLNLKLTSGGSSGGEGSLIAAGASPLGFGTDIGGSIRIPSGLQGLYGLRPSGHRFSYLRVTNSYSSQEAMPSVIGPMARSLADLEYITRTVFGGELWKSDPKVLPVPFAENESLKQSKLTFGLWKFDQRVMPHPPIVRALEETALALRAQGHEVINIQVPNIDDILGTALKIFTADKGVEVENMCAESGEPPVPCVQAFVSGSPGEVPINVSQWWDLCKEQYHCKLDFYEYWDKTRHQTRSGKPIDAIVCPVWPYASFTPGQHNALNYSCPFNLLDCASVVVPVSKIDKELDPLDATYQPLNQLDKDVYQCYDPALFHGMPVCVQVVAKRCEDEKALAAALVVDSCMKK